MASPRHTRHGHQHSLVSDYESDGHYLSDMQTIAHPPAPPAPRTNAELNLAVVSRYRPDTIGLEYVLPYVVVYTLSAETNAWEKIGLEGTGFLCALSPNNEYDYRCAVVVLNRRGMDNLNIELVRSGGVEPADPYVFIHDELSDKPKIYGLWIFREPPPSSTAHHPEAFLEKLLECTKKAEDSKKKQPRGKQNGKHLDQQDSTPMGRQISLRELFGQQRQEDDTWSVRSHSPSRRTSTTIPVQPLIPEVGPFQNATQFQASADTDFFRSAPPPSGPVSPLPPPASQAPSQQQTLLDLFRKASEQRVP